MRTKEEEDDKEEEHLKDVSNSTWITKNQTHCVKVGKRKATMRNKKENELVVVVL